MIQLACALIKYADDHDIREQVIVQASRLAQLFPKSILEDPLPEESAEQEEEENDSLRKHEAIVELF